MGVNENVIFWLKHVIIGSVLSALVFFSISFFTYLDNISPLHYYQTEEWYHVEIGFPKMYYYEFFMDGGYNPNSGWREGALLFDIFITWIVVTGSYLLFKKIKKEPKYNLDKLDASHVEVDQI